MFTMSTEVVAAVTVSARGSFCLRRAVCSHAVSAQTSCFSRNFPHLGQIMTFCRSSSTADSIIAAVVKFYEGVINAAASVEYMWSSDPTQETCTR